LYRQEYKTTHTFLPNWYKIKEIIEIIDHARSTLYLEKENYLAKSSNVCYHKIAAISFNESIKKHRSFKVLELSNQQRQ
jgi:hypothetical protein